MKTTCERILLPALAGAGVLALSQLLSCGSGTTTKPPRDTHTEDSAPPVCTDRDGDGYGRNCSRGGDCNDNDKEHWADCEDCRVRHQEGCACTGGESYFCYDGPAGTDGVGECKRGVRRCAGTQLGACEGQVLPENLENCDDDKDNNCNGQTDETYMCGDCVPPCYTEGGVVPSPADPGAVGLVPNPDGEGVILGASADSGGFAWAANSSEGTVSKLDVKTGTEMGRYRVGLAGTGADSPSRTAVDDYQNAYVANRAFDRQGSVTKIAGFERYCVDRNTNGTIDTSHGSTPLALGQDECVLWTKPVGGVNGIPRALTVDFGAMELEVAEPWVGLYNEMRAYKLDPGDGDVEETVDLNVHTYGFAIDSGGWIWASGRNSYAIQRFHMTTRAVEPPIAIAEPICRGTNPYGITVDLKDRVWVGIWPGGACRYEPATGQWFFVDTGGTARGVAVDQDNVIWATNDQAAKLYRFSADDGGASAFFSVPGSTPIGVGADLLGRIWTINRGSNNAARFDKASGTFQTFPVGSGPYTYSDFLGLQRWLSMPKGIWIRTFERCDDKASDKWMAITWETETPADSNIRIVARSADAMSLLLSAPEVQIADIQPDPDVGSKDIEAVYAAEGEETGKYLEITVFLEGGTSGTEPVSPILKSIHVFYYCSDLG